ncbi:hypothetical protein PN419_00380 [Halorubrum ezzemoulense]|uniref:hypothetical protein n=1 Tax=Halorubrum ezzemoulense TaxID=337243 RepID=UPI00232BEAE9|nr:hypothetical protein [Halorubrum ezzemoulense]MDB9247463.1 hypothetical protein [Halorubrum ezzemoulense]MDB9258628.1 hypothetical protein [Halorubrum ezzemoulense]MDB9264514.1 hypothetical protein [Halorubrum ezzemoulense]MDB9268989.1 hypothetical protein [Halorubrum ezzemoulense]MDB9271482.1 hypothetical protein [Halorubrum ezzemoulense]
MTETDQSLPTERNDEYVAGDTALVELTITNSNGNPKQLGGAEIVFALAEYRGADPLVTKTTDDGITIVDAENGRVDIRVSGNDTATLGSADGTNYYYEIEVTDDSGDVSTVTTGEWTIYADTA